MYRGLELTVWDADAKIISIECQGDIPIERARTIIIACAKPGGSDDIPNVFNTESTPSRPQRNHRGRCTRSSAKVVLKQICHGTIRPVHLRVRQYDAPGFTDIVY